MPLTIGEAMRQARLQAGLTLRQAAPLLGVDEATLSRYERDVVEPPLQVLMLAGRAYRSSLPQWVYLARAIRLFLEVA
ncbi:MAG TPA: helix-turn-helix domain-containing protein [Thermaerobacter sp.]